MLMGVLIDRYSLSTAFLALSLIGAIAIIIVAVNYRLDRKMFPKLYERELRGIEKTA